MCLREYEAKQVLIDVLEGVYSNHSGGRALAHKVLCKGYYWPTIQQDSADFAQFCDKCQRFTLCLRQPSEKLTSMSSPWPFAKWGINLIGPLPKARGQVKYAIIPID